MTIRTSFAFFAAAVIAIGATAAVHAQALSGPGQPVTIDLSAQNNKDKDKDKNKNKDQNKDQNKNKNKNNQSGGQNQSQQKVQNNQSQQKVQNNVQKNGQNKNKQKNTNQTKNTKSATGNKAPRVVAVTGTQTVTAARIRGISARGAGSASIHGRNYSTWRGGGYRARYGNRWVTLVPLAVLAGIVVGGSTYYPYAYISAPRDYCDGLTEDGCQLMWDEVETVEGDVASQCVAFCPWRD